MIDLKLSKAEKKETESPKEISEGNEYPYGTELRFRNESIQKIKTLQNIKAGTMLNIKALGKVIEVRITDKEKGKSYESVEIQIQQISIEIANEAEESFNEE